MQKEVKLLIGIFIACIMLAAANFGVKTWASRASELITPYSNSFSIFSLFRKHELPKSTVYGFTPYWTLDESENLQLDRLTDIAYFGLNINADGTFKTRSEDGTTDPGYNNWKNNKTLDGLIKKSKSYGVRFAVTIISHNDEISDSFLTCESCWDKFIVELEKEMVSKGIKDVNLNFEYSAYTDSSYADQYTKFAKFVNEHLDRRFGKSNVVVSTFADSNIKPRVTKPGDLAKYVDGIFIMAYDFHRPDSDNAGPVSPINGGGTHTEYDITTMLKDYLSNVPPNKIILGVPYYGYNWVVESRDPMSSRIPGNDYAGYSQSQTYSAIMETLLETKAEVKWDDVGKVPYFTYISPETGSTRQVYYENVESLRIKYELAKTNNLSGIGIWALGYDGGYVDLWNLIGEVFGK